MKNEAVTTRPIASMNTARVGYHASGTGLEIGFADWAFHKKNSKKKKKYNKITSKFSKKKSPKTVRLTTKGDEIEYHFFNKFERIWDDLA